MLSKERTIECLEKYFNCDSNTCLRRDCDGCENDYPEDFKEDVLTSALIYLKEENNTPEEEKGKSI